MNFLKVKWVIWGFFMNIFFAIKGYSLESTYVYCVSPRLLWHWLVDDNNKYVQVYGDWVLWGEKNSAESVSFSYFILENAFQVIITLSEKCKQKFGSEFYTPQPADNSLHSWKLFAIDKKTFFRGIVTVSISHQSIRASPNRCISISNFTKHKALILSDDIFGLYANLAHSDQCK